MSDQVRKVVIIGSGCAGLTAALYTARAQLNPLVLNGNQPGGQLTTTTVVENFPGFVEGVDGTALVQNIMAQAEHFGTEIKHGVVASVDASVKPIKITLTDGEVILTKALIIATGARPRMLGLESENTYWSKGVTSCATCDGFFYRKKDVAVVGGGDSAMEEATFLTRMCNKVYLVHRREAFRASKIMTERALANPKIEVVYNSVVEEVVGNGTHLTGLRVKNTQSGEEKVLDVSAMFLAIGHIPNTEVFSFLDRDENGYILTKPGSTYTNVEGVFACGDCVDHVYRQAITAAGTGCMAAIDAERWLETQGQ